MSTVLFSARHVGLDVKTLLAASVQRGEGTLSAEGALVVQTGDHTGRSPKDKFVVDDALTHDSVWWSNNAAMGVDAFDRLLADFQSHAEGRELFSQDLFAGADPEHRIGVRVFTELAWHSLFIRNLLIRPNHVDIESFIADLTIIDLPSFKADPARHDSRGETIIACNFTRKIILIGGTAYAGEIKKAVFTYLNFILPQKGVMPMHCSANVGAQGDVAVFFGLSGTGKTTLSADPHRTLIGDDEHGWSERGVFNFEGGCYAKTIRLSAAGEPEIFAATQQAGTVLENVVLDPVTLKPDFEDASRTENTRAAYPLDVIPNASRDGRCGIPKNIIMLTCDAFGILPPVAMLTPEQAMEYFLAGYTAKVAGTETGITEPQATFSACFGAPFMPRPPQIYGAMLKSLIARHRASCWLLNTGWTGGPYGIGKRISLEITRQLLKAILDGSLADGEFRMDPTFGLMIPVEVKGINSELLIAAETWTSRDAYQAQAAKLKSMFDEASRQVADVNLRVAP